LYPETIFATSKLAIGIRFAFPVTTTFPVPTLVSQMQSVMYGQTDGQYEFLHIYADKMREGGPPVLRFEYGADCPHSKPLISCITYYHTAVDI
jgi:hypothetical protein